MKTDRKGRIILQKGDYRTGNFIFHEEENFVKVMASSGIISWRITKLSAIGQMVTIAIKEKREEWLKTYAAMNFSQLMIVPDSEYFVKHSQLLNDQTSLHPELYGVKSDPSEEEDKQILQEEKELQEELGKH